MYKGKKIAVIIPAYNEEKLIDLTTRSVPKYVDFIITINDASSDSTLEKLKTISLKSQKISYINSKKNEGVGASILKGHKKAIEQKADLLAVMAGDNQMNPDFLNKLLDKIIDGGYDYVKGNRFYHDKELKSMPLTRKIGNIIITFIAKISTGYWSVSDPLNGYTVLKSSAFSKLNLKNINKRYDFEISILGELNSKSLRVSDVYIPAKYNNEISSINYYKDGLQILNTTIKLFVKRIFWQNLLVNLKVFSVFYFIGSLLFIFGTTFGIFIAFYSIGPNTGSTATVMLSIVPFISGLQFLLQAIVLDIQSEPKKES